MCKSTAKLLPECNEISHEGCHFLTKCGIVLKYRIDVERKQLMGFCVKCGAQLLNGICPRCSGTGLFPQQPAFNADGRLRQYFSNPNENVLCVLGAKHMQGYLNTNNSKKGFAVLTDQRVYIFGRYFDYINTSNYRYAVGPRSYALNEITSTDLRFSQITYLLVAGLVLLALFVLVTFLLAGTVFFYGLLIASILDIIYYFMSMKTVYILSSVNGSKIALAKRWYSDAELNNFNNLLCQIKNGQFQISAAPAQNVNPAADLRNVQPMQPTAPMRQNVQPVQSTVQPTMQPTAPVQSTVPAQPMQQTVRQNIQPTAPIQPTQFTAAPQGSGSIADELAKYAQLHKDGVISDEEFNELKAKLLSQQ